LRAQPVQPTGTVVPRFAGSRLAEDIDRPHEFYVSTVGWIPLGRVLWSSGSDQVTPSPKVWPKDIESYGRRFITRSAQLVVIEAVRHGASAALDRDPVYVRCSCEGVGARLRHATLGVVTDFDTKGRRRIGWPRFAGALAGALALGQLQPEQNKAGTVVLRTGLTVAGALIGNTALEFSMLPGDKHD
jgi:hypothetical protein